MRGVNESNIEKKLGLIPRLKKSKFYEKKIVKIKFLFNFQNFDTIMFAKPLATEKIYFKKLEGGGWPM